MTGGELGRFWKSFGGDRGESVARGCALAKGRWSGFRTRGNGRDCGG